MKTTKPTPSLTALAFGMASLLAAIVSAPAASPSNPAQQEVSEIEIALELANPVLLANQSNTSYLRLGLTGFELGEGGERPPINVALILDRSGSMSGSKLARAKEAAGLAIELLSDQDIVSIITYDSTVDVLLPATRLGDRSEILRRINAIESGGNTALFGGVAKGAAELRKFLSEDRVNRAILLSDGIANVGPNSPGELAELGASLAKEGIAVTTLGLGTDYNEDLMMRLAGRSDGNHVFVQEAAQLAGIFGEEFGDILSVVAQEVTVRIRCADGVKPIRVLGREAEIAGQEITTTLNQLYAEREKYILVEVEVDPAAEGIERQVATAKVSYQNMASGSPAEVTDQVAARFESSPEVVASNVNRTVSVSATLQIATDNNKQAMQLRDEGKIAEAKITLTENRIALGEASVKWAAPELEAYAVANEYDLLEIEDDTKWDARRKSMRFNQSQNIQQQKAEFVEVQKSAPADKSSILKKIDPKKAPTKEAKKKSFRKALPAK